MFTNILLLSLLSITCGRTRGEDRNLRENAYNMLEMPIQQQYEDMNFFKTPRAIRTPFRNTEIMTARGFGKRAGVDYGNANDDMENYASLQEDRWQRPVLFPFFQDVFGHSRSSLYNSYNNLAVPKRNDLKFRLNDGNLRIGRGFGKRSYSLDTTPSNSISTGEMMKALLDENSQLKQKESKEET